MARVNITWSGRNGDLPDEIPYDLPDNEVFRLVTEAVRGGDVPGLAGDEDANFDGFIVDRMLSRPGK